MRHRFQHKRIRPLSVAAWASLSILVAACRAPVDEPAAVDAASTEPAAEPTIAEKARRLNGIWQALNEAHWNIEPHAADHAPLPELGALGASAAGLGVVEGGAIPYQPWAAERKRQNYAERLALDPEAKCYLPGVPRATYLPYPFQILATEQYVMIAYTYAGAVRTIHMNDPGPSPADSWMGWSIGRWEGDTLVVDVTGLNDQTWLDRAGNFHSNALHVVERYTPQGPNHLLYEATIEDPNVFTRPWTIRMPLYRRIEENAQLLEFKCVEFSEELLYGKYRKQPRQ